MLYTDIRRGDDDADPTAGTYPRLLCLQDFAGFMHGANLPLTLCKRALRQIELVGRQAVEELQHLRSFHHVGLFGVHIAQLDGVPHLRAIGASLLGKRDAIIETE